MSTDDFEARLRARLADLADHEDDWDDPAPRARELAAAGIAPDDDPAILSPAAPAPERRRWLPGLAVAAVVIALVVGGGLGIRALVRSGGTGGAGSAAMSVEGDGSAAPAASGAATSAASAAAGGGCVAGGTGPCDETVDCATGAGATSTGPLSGVGSVRPSGIVGSRTTSGGTIGIPYQLTFAEAGGTAQLRAAYAARTSAGALCGSSGVATPDHVQAVTVAPGAGVSGTATFTAVDSDGTPLPAGDYLAVIVIPYSVDGSEPSQLVSAPVSVVVS